MKHAVIIVVILAALGGGVYYYVFHMQKKEVVAETTTPHKVERGNIMATVASSGRVASNLDVDIKCKASGEIINLPFDISATVQKGDLLVELDPVDMKRELTRAEVQLAGSEARLRSAQRNLDVATKTLATDTLRAEAALASATAKAADAQAKASRTRQLVEKNVSSDEELETSLTAAVQAETELKNAQIKLEELKTQELALELRRLDVTLAENTVEDNKVAVQMARDRLEDTKVLSPMDGVVAACAVQKGVIISSGVNNVGGGTTIMTLSDLSRLFVYAAVDESDIGRVQLGQAVNIRADAFPGVTFDGRVTRIATKGSNVSNVVTFEVQIEVLGERRRGGGGSGGTNASGGEKPQRGGEGAPRGEGGLSRPAEGSATRGLEALETHGLEARATHGRDAHATSRDAHATVRDAQATPRARLKPEMTADVEIVVADRRDVVVVPSEAVSRKGGQQFVTLIKPDGATEEVPVTVGITDGTLVEILSGLDSGQTVQLRKGSGSRWSGQAGPGGPGGGAGGGRSPMMPMMGGGGGGGRR